MIKSKKMFLRVSLLTLSSISYVVPAFASNPGVNANNWVTKNVGALIPGVLLCVCVYFLFTRDWMKLISFFALTLVVAMIMNWTAMQALATTLWKAVFG